MRLLPNATGRVAEHQCGSRCGGDCSVFDQYDSSELLAAFSSQYDISFTMLSDRGSRVIQRLGLLNPRVQEQHAEYGIAPNPAYHGVSYPAVFFVDQAGVVIDRRINANYRVRETGRSLISRVMGEVPPPELEYRASLPRMGVRVWADSPTYSGFQELQLFIELSIADGWHVYGHPVPKGYKTVGLDFQPVEGVEVGSVRWPPPDPFEFASLDETFHVYERKVVAVAPMMILQQGQGPVVISGNIEFQMCSSQECLPPASVPWSLEIDERPHAARAGS